jgi:hypothetical protein
MLEDGSLKGDSPILILKIFRQYIESKIKS